MQPLADDEDAIPGTEGLDAGAPRARLRVGASVVCLLAASAFVPARQGPQGSSAPELRLDVLVTNDLGGAVPGLRAEDFAIREDAYVRRSPSPIPMDS